MIASIPVSTASKRLGRMIVLVLIVTTFLAVDASAATYYVSTSGNDGNSCATAQSTTQASQKRTISAGLTCLSAGDTLFIHGGTYAENLFVPSSANGSSSGASGSSWPNATNVSAYTGETVWVTPSGGINGVEFSTSGGTSQYQIWSGININGSNSLVQLVYLGHASNHIRWQNSEAKNSCWVGFQAFPGPYIEIKNNRIHDGDAGCGMTDPGHGIYISGYPGNPVGQDDHGLIEGNEIYNFNRRSNDSAAQLYEFPGNPDMLGGYVVRKNWFHDNGVGSFLTNATTVPIKYYDNIVEHNTGAGIDVYQLISGVQIYNNTIYANGDSGIDVGVNTRVTGVLIKNNAIVGNGGAPVKIWNSDAFSTATIQFNDFYGNGNGNAVNDQNGLSTISSNITSAPGFTNAGAHDFRISAGGSLVNAGTAVATVTDDYLGVSRPQGSNYDIGAYEYNGGGGPPPPPSAPTGLHIIP